MGSQEKKAHRDRGKKDKKNKKDKKHRKSKFTRRKHCADSGSSSDSDGPVDVNKQLAMGRAAARAAREILAFSYNLKEELRELFRQLDGGEALDVSEVPDDFVRAKLCVLLDNLVQVTKNAAGHYYRQELAAPVLSFIAPLLEETPASLAAYAPPAAKAPEAGAGTGSKPDAATHTPRPPTRVGGDATADTQHRTPGAAAGHAPASAQQARASTTTQQAGPAPQPENPPVPAQPIGPDIGPQSMQEGLVESSEEDNGGAASRGVRPEGSEGGAAEEGGGGAAVVEEGTGTERRVLGPSMPSAQQLEAAAQMEYVVEEEQQEGLDDLLVGPPPPELEDEMSTASMDERSAEVVRVSKVLSQHVAGLQGSTAAQAAEQSPDPYQVLGVGDEATAADVKKRYWRLSLMIHPDKCDHPQAHDAFQAVAKAAKEVQDAALRHAVDERRREKALRAEFEAEAAEAERQRQWRVLRGEATAADLAGPSTEQFGGPSRDTWMTELPPERAAGTALPSLTNQVTFSKAGIKPRGDTSAWTLTPAQRAVQLEQGPGAGQGPLLLTVAGGGAAQQPSQRIAAATELYNSKMRKKSLLEQHLDKQQQPAKKKRKKGEKGEGSKGAKPDWDPAEHPWRPFDREKDLGPSLSGPANPQDLLKNTKSLSSRFSAG